jgi:hypothetical protein
MNTTTTTSLPLPAATLIADLLVPFAEAGSLRLRDAPGTLRKRIIASLHFADVERVHEALFPRQHLDWPAVRAFLSDATHTMGTSEWVRLVTLLHFIKEPPTRPAIRELLLSAAAGTRVTTQGRDLTPIESLQLCFARAAVAPTWDTLCKTLILSNLADVDTALALNLLLADSTGLLTPLLSSGGGSCNAIGPAGAGSVGATTAFATIGGGGGGTGGTSTHAGALIP